MPYHPHINDQVEISNREIKSILANTINANRIDWARKLDDELQAYQMTFNTPIGISLYHFVYGKSFHLPVDLEHKAQQALKQLNLEKNDVTKLRLENLMRWMNFASIPMNDQLYMKRG